jgi:predicted  nucleic acid-binding Zn-ribbon protein
MEMKEIFSKLMALQDILAQKIALEQEMQAIPKALFAQDEVLSRNKKKFIDQNQEYNKKKFLERDLRKSLEDAELARENAEKKMELISTQREYEALDKEINDSREREQKYHKELLQENRKIIELEEGIKHSEEGIIMQENLLKQLRASTEQEIANCQEIYNDLLLQEEALTSDIDPEVLFKFERIVRNKRGKGVVPINGSICSGCHIMLPAQFANNIHNGEEIIFCPCCSRILIPGSMVNNNEDFLSIEEAGSLSDLDDREEEEDDDDLDDEEEETINIDYEE